MIEKIICVYKIESLSTKRIYVGSTIDYKRRQWQHFHELKKNRHCSPFLQNHFNIHGIEDLTISVLEILPNKDTLLIKEQYWIDLLKPIFNTCPVAGIRSGYKLSLEHIKKLSAINKGKIISQETREKISNSKKGCIPSEEHKEKIKASVLEYYKNAGIVKRPRKNPINKATDNRKNSGRRSPYTMSQEHKDNISRAKKGKKLSPEHIEKLKKPKTKRHS